MTWAYFEEFETGRVDEFGSYHFERDEVIRFARAYDPQAFHLDDEAGERGHALGARGVHDDDLAGVGALEPGRQLDDHLAGGAEHRVVLHPRPHRRLRRLIPFEVIHRLAGERHGNGDGERTNAHARCEPER